MRCETSLKGLYYSKASEVSGIKVADLSFESIDSFFKSNPDLAATISSTVAESKDPTDPAEIERISKVLALKLPWPKKEAQPFIDYVQNKVDELKLESPPKLLALPTPSSTGLKRAREEILYWAFPGKSDWAKITRDEVIQGIQSVAISSGISITTQILLQGWKVGLPAGIMNMGFSLSTTIPRPLWNNYFSKHVNTFDRWGKQFWMTTYFTIGVYWASKILFPTFADILTTSGWEIFGKTKLHSIVLGTLWRKPMEHGLNDYVAKESAFDKERELKARKNAAIIRKIGTITSTNFWLFSVLYPKILFHLGVDWNWGHMGMIASAVVFNLLEKNPQYYQLANKDFRREKIKILINKIIDSSNNFYWPGQ
ncbi:MAG: hypothetical protein JWQ35_2564 [Bacteriovoracaceae bacterium]|nr:hypothetical protein [Bacteriovoracaceae bacterium]